MVQLSNSSTATTAVYSSAQRRRQQRLTTAAQHGTAGRYATGSVDSCARIGMVRTVRRFGRYGRYGRSVAGRFTRSVGRLYVVASNKYSYSSNSKYDTANTSTATARSTATAGTATVVDGSVDMRRSPVGGPVLTDGWMDRVRIDGYGIRCRYAELGGDSFRGFGGCSSAVAVSGWISRMSVRSDSRMRGLQIL